MKGQMSIFDFIQQEPEVGAYLTEHGQVICHIMRPGYIGQKVCFDCSTQSLRLFKVGILEKILEDHYWHLTNGQYKMEPCDRVVIYTGTKQRSLISLMPGREIFECLPWDAYPERMAAIGRK